MPKFRKKPVEIEARDVPSADPFPGLQWDGLAEWCGGEVSKCAVEGWCILIETLEGTMKALPGDWIIKGVKGEFYPCKPDIFAATYEPVEESETHPLHDFTKTEVWKTVTPMSSIKKKDHALVCSREQYEEFFCSLQHHEKYCDRRLVDACIENIVCGVLPVVPLAKDGEEMELRPIADIIAEGAA